MASQAQDLGSSPTGFLQLPTEILIEIVTHLRNIDLRRLARVNHRFQFFIEDYLNRYRYPMGLAALPNELLLKIAHHIGDQSDRSRLARASARFYPIVMDYILRYNVRHDESNLLPFAVKWNLKRMTSLILHLGADVNTPNNQHDTRSRRYIERPTALMTAASYGRQSILEILLKHGAAHSVGTLKRPLTLAIVQGYESVARFLYHELETFDDSPRKYKRVALRFACLVKLVNLVRYFLEYEARSERRADSPSVCTLSHTLCHVLETKVSDNDFIKRELHSRTYEMMWMLLTHGADPDRIVRTTFSNAVTARDMASRHPDPRIRNFLSKPISATHTNKLPSQIGRTWLSFGDQNDTITEPEFEELPLEIASHARLWVFLAKKPTLMECDENDADDGSTASDITESVENGRQSLGWSPSVEPPLLWSLPPYRPIRSSAMRKVARNTRQRISGLRNLLRLLQPLANSRGFPLLPTSYLITRIS